MEKPFLAHPENDQQDFLDIVLSMKLRLIAKFEFHFNDLDLHEPL